VLDCQYEMKVEVSQVLSKYCPVPVFLAVKLPLSEALHAWQQRETGQVGASAEHQFPIFCSV
jgi:hypothetical protein